MPLVLIISFCCWTEHIKRRNKRKIDNSGIGPWGLGFLLVEHLLGFCGVQICFYEGDNFLCFRGQMKSLNFICSVQLLFFFFFVTLVYSLLDNIPVLH